MVHLHVLSGKKAGNRTVASHFPFRIGRASKNHLSLEDDGVWDHHLSLEFKRKDGIHLTASPSALAAINGSPVETALLRNGDIITVGSAKIQFWLAPAKQKGLRMREYSVWMLLGLITFLQVALICFLRR